MRFFRAEEFRLGELFNIPGYVRNDGCSTLRAALNWGMFFIPVRVSADCEQMLELKVLPASRRCALQALLNAARFIKAEGT